MPSDLETDKQDYWHMYKLKQMKLKPGLEAVHAIWPGNGWLIDWAGFNVSTNTV